MSPLARIPFLFNYIKSLTYEKWSSTDRVESYTRANEASGKRYQLTIIHAEDDIDIPSQHAQAIFWHAVKGAISGGISTEELELEKLKSRADLGAGGSMMEWRTKNGVIREEILKYGLHDVMMGYSIITIAVMRMLAP